MNVIEIKKFVFALSFAILTSFFLSFFYTQKTYADYNGARLIDDQVFLNYKSMSMDEIQKFLESRNSGLASKKQFFNCAQYGVDSIENKLYQTLGAPCNQLADPSKFIYYASQIYGINPQVIIATLQKEQSLITSPNPSDWQINQAMGYKCPDNGGCSSNSSFFYQIDNGATVLRLNYERSNKNTSWWPTISGYNCGQRNPSTFSYYRPSLYPKQYVDFYDDNNVLYRTYYIENASTTSLYCYTPHAYNNPRGEFGLAPFGSTGQYYSGSYNFVLFFEKWFGSTVRNLVTAPGLGIYQIENGMKRPFPNSITFLSYSYRWSDVVNISQSEVNQIPDGNPMTYNTSFRNGKLVTSPTKGIYLVENGLKRPFGNQITFISSYSYSNVFYLSDYELSLIPEGNAMGYNTHYRDGLLISVDGNSVFKVENGLKRGISSIEAFYSNGYKFIDIKKVSALELSLIPNGDLIGYNSMFRNGKLISNTLSGVYLVENGKKRPFPSDIVFISQNYSWSNILSVSSSEIGLLVDGEAMTYNVHFRDGRLVGTRNSGIYLIENGKKRPFPNAETFISYSYKWVDVLVLREDELSLIPNGLSM